MKQLLLFFIFLFSFTSNAQNKKKALLKTQPINISKVYYIEIKKSDIDSDTLIQHRKILTDLQQKKFIDIWNNAPGKGPYKFIPQYYIDVYLKDGSSISFRINNNIIKSNNDLGYNLGKGNFITNLWEQSKEHPIISIQTVFEDYVKYNESTDSKEDQNLMSKSLQQLTLTNNLPLADLNLLINVWMYYVPTDFPDISLIFDILKKNKPQSITAIENRIKYMKNWESADSVPYSDLQDLLTRLQNN